MPPADTQIVEALRLAGCSPKTSGAGQWHIKLPGARARRCSARVEENWLVLECAARGTRIANDPKGRRRAWALLERRIERPGGARPVLESVAPALRVRAEVVIASRENREPRALAERLRRALDGLRTQVDGAGRADVEPAAPALAEEASGDGFAAHAEALCAETGWRASTRADGTVAVELHLAGATVRHALLDGRGAEPHLTVALALDEDTLSTGACRLALAVLLLRGAGKVRTLAASVVRTDGGLVASLEAPLAGGLDAPALDQACSVLVVACEQLAREAQLLARDDGLARAYLAVLGLH